MKSLLVPFIVLGLVITPAQGNIISYLRFEEGSGYYAADETGLMNGALLGGWPTFDPGGGDWGYAGWSTSVAAPIIPLTGQPNTGSLHFPGSSPYVNLSNPNHVNLGTSFTIEFFFLAEQIFGQSPMFHLSPVSNLAGVLGDGPGFATYFQDTINHAPGDLVVFDQWQHYALVKQPGEYSLYIDGLLQFNGLLSPETDGPYFFFGTDISGDREIGEGFRGWLDEFRISDEALTPDRFLCSIPEPSTAALIVLGLLGLFDRRRIVQPKA